MLDKVKDSQYLSIIESWLDDDDSCLTSHITDTGEHIVAYHYLSESGFDGDITIISGQDWKNVLENGFIGPIVDYLSKCKREPYLEQTYFSAKELDLLKPYLDIDFKTKLSENISSIKEGEFILNEQTKGAIK